MTKTRPVLLWLLLFSPFLGLGQLSERSQPVSSPLWSGPTVDYFNRQPVFTVHRLTDRVEPKKKHTYERLTEGRPVSLPCPTQPQQPRRLC